MNPNEKPKTINIFQRPTELIQLESGRVEPMVSSHRPTLIAFTAIMLAILILVVLGSLSASGETSDLGVDVQADEYSGETGNPGDLLSYDVRIKNTGYINDTYEIFVQHGELNWSAKHWAVVAGLDGNVTDVIEPDEWRYYSVDIRIPDFSPENNDAMEGVYDLRIRAQSTTNRTIMDDAILYVVVEEYYDLRIWSDVTENSGTILMNDDAEVTFTINVRNFGNTNDDIKVSVPDDSFQGDQKNWRAKFGTMTWKTLTLDPLEQKSAVLTLFIDDNTDPGEYTLDVKAESQGDIAIYNFFTVFIDLDKAVYGVNLEKFPTGAREVNPADESEIEYKFTLTNTGNQKDTFTVDVETPLGSGIYKDWIIEFEDKDYNRVDELSIPLDLRGNTDLYLSKGERVDITLFVTVAIDEDEDLYEDIAISATSDNDYAQVEYVYFSITVILPNIRLSDDPQDFYIEPDWGIEEDDSLDIHLRVYNDGSTETDEFIVVFYNGKSESGNNKAGSYITYEKVDNIPAGQYTDVSVIWDEIEGGENDIYAYADKPVDSGEIKTFIDNKFSSDGKVIESRENDNTASIDDRFQVEIDLRPDLKTINVGFEGRKAGTTTTVTVTVANIGSATALSSSVRVNLKIGGTSLKGTISKQIQPFIQEEIEANDDAIIIFEWEIPDESNNFTVKVTVDHDDDSDSSNDRMTTYVQTTKESSGFSSTTDVASESITENSVFTLFIGILIGAIGAVWATTSMGSPGNSSMGDLKKDPNAPQGTTSPKNAPDLWDPYRSTLTKDEKWGRNGKF